MGRLAEGMGLEVERETQMVQRSLRVGQQMQSSECVWRVTNRLEWASLTSVESILP